MIQAPFLTVEELAQKEGVSVRMARYWCEKGRVIYAAKIGHIWMIDRNYLLRRAPVGRPRKQRYV